MRTVEPRQDELSFEIDDDGRLALHLRTDFVSPTATTLPSSIANASA